MKQGAPLGRIRIASIGLEAVVLEGVSPQDLARGPGHLPGTGLPGMAGNVAIAGHRTTFGAPFRRLDRLKPGDIIHLEFDGVWWEYEVEKSFAVKPNALWVLEDEGGAILTLITCHPPYSAAERLIIRARLRANPP